MAASATSAYTRASSGRSSRSRRRHPLAPGVPRGGLADRVAVIGDAVRRRVGVHHLTLEALLNALVQPGARLERVVERGDGPLPEVLGVLLSRPS
ncbi:MAG: hypothetical protein ACR2KN_04065 [Geodermatophilaceae bacterium]